jgi:hypothetical protein
MDPPRASSQEGFRRRALALGVAALFASLPTRVLAGDPSLAVDAEAYAGQSTGEWACGPRSVARYGGLGARATLSERPVSAENGVGTYGTLGGTSEYEVVEIGGFQHGPGQLMPGGGLTVGHRSRSAGFAAGALVFAGHDRPTSATNPAWFPDLQLDLGNARSFGWRLGCGAPSVSNYRRPAVLFTGPRFVMDASTLEVLAGFYRSGAASLESAQFRVDGALQFQLSPRFLLGPHLALAAANRATRLPFDGELGLRLGF